MATDPFRAAVEAGERAMAKKLEETVWSQDPYVLYDPGLTSPPGEQCYAVMVEFPMSANLYGPCGHVDLWVEAPDFGTAAMLACKYVDAHGWRPHMVMAVP